MAEKVAKVGVKKEGGYLYFVDKSGDVSRAKMARGGRKKGSTGTEKVANAGVKKEQIINELLLIWLCILIFYCDCLRDLHYCLESQSQT